MARLEHVSTGVVVSVADEKVSRLGAEWRPIDDSAPAKSETPDLSWKVAEIREFAEANGIDLGDAKKKDELLAAIADSSVDAESEGEEPEDDAE